MTYIMNVLNRYRLSEKVITICGDSCNTNFVGAVRRGAKYVFTRLETRNLKMNIQGIEYATYILHNALHTSAGIQQNDVESIVNKILNIFTYIWIRWKK
jgi:hypothetical protein